MCVSKPSIPLTSPSAFSNESPHPGLRQVVYNHPTLVLIHSGNQRTYGNLNNIVLPSPTHLVIPASSFPILRMEATFVSKRPEHMLPRLGRQNNISPIAPIAPVRASHRNVLLPPEADRASSPITTLNHYSCGIYHNIYVY